MGYYSPKLPVKEYGRKVPSVMATDLHIDDPKNYTFHSYRMPAATAVVDARATSDQMQDFFDWANAKISTEYIFRSQAAIIKVAQKLQDTETTTLSM